MNEKMAGILGGMGPKATVVLLEKIIQYTTARNDQEHIRILIYNNPKIPDRTTYILGKGLNPLPELIVSARILEKAGVDFLAIPCITSHYFFSELQNSIDIPVIHLILEMLRYVKGNLPLATKLGVLATSGTIKTSLFQNIFGAAGIDILVPDSNSQEKLVMQSIYGPSGIKAGIHLRDTKDRLVEAANLLIGVGADGIIGGCTEIPLVLTQQDLTVPFFDPICILALAVIREAQNTGWMNHSPAK